MLDDLGLYIHVYTSALTQALRTDDCTAARAAFQGYLRSLPRGFDAAHELGLTKVDFRNMFNAVRNCDLHIARQVLGISLVPRPPQASTVPSLPRAMVEEAVRRAESFRYLTTNATAANQTLLDSFRTALLQTAPTAPSTIALDTLLHLPVITNWALSLHRTFRPSRLQLFVTELFASLMFYPRYITDAEYDAIHETVRAWRLSLFPGAAP